MTEARSAKPSPGRPHSCQTQPDRKPRALDLACDVNTGNAHANHMLLIMARLGNRTLQCYASEQTLADRCGFSLSTASRAINYLKARSYIKQIICRPRKRRTNTYDLCITLWITRRRGSPCRTHTRSDCTSKASQVDRQNHGLESGSQRHGAETREALSVGGLFTTLVSDLKAHSGRGGCEKASPARRTPALA